VESVAREAAASSPRNEVRAEVTASPRVHGDRERIHLALRNLIGEALGSSRPGALVTVLLRREGADADIGVRYEARPCEELASEPGADNGDLRVGHLVLTTIVEAHGGALREETVAPETTAWIRLPAIEVANEPA
jgi:hypothetical protein